MAWFAGLRKRRRHEQVSAMYAQLRAADDEQRAGVVGDPEHQERIARIRAEVAEWYADTRRGGYTG